jgi:DNA-binding GntR family transcriptional regulator
MGHLPRIPLSNRAYDAILQGIFSGRLFPGKILSEVVLVRELAMNRTPIISAIQEPIKDGLVTKEKDRRPVIRQFTPNELQELFEMRRLLEGEAAHRAATRIDRLTLSRIRSVGGTLRSGLSKPHILAKRVNFDEEFYWAVAHAFGNRRLANDIGRYRMIHRGFIPMRLRLEHIPQAYAEHMRILEPLSGGTPRGLGT